MKQISIVLAALALAATACGSDDVGTAGTELGGVESPVADSAVEDSAVQDSAVEDSVVEDSGVPARTVASSIGDTVDVAAEPALSIAGTDVGSVLVDAHGDTVYLFTNDVDGSTCNAGCDGTWPPVPAPVSAGDGVNPELIGSVTRDDGTEQATYGGWPVYYYAGDTEPGQTNGQGVGGVWFVVDATGIGVGAPLDDGY